MLPSLWEFAKDVLPAFMTLKPRAAGNLKTAVLP